MRILLATSLLIVAAPALAQGGVNSSNIIVPARPANERPADAKNNDGRALASPTVIAVITAAKARTRVLQDTDAAQIRDLVLSDGKLDDAEFDLLDELSAQAIRAITVAPTSGKGPSEITGTISGNALRVFEAVFEQRYRANWEAKDPVAGWAALVEEARRSDGSHSRIRRFLARIATEAAQASTAANTYEPARKVLAGFYSRNADKLPQSMRVLGRRLQYEAMVDADINTAGRLPDFFHDLLKQPPKPAAAPAK